VGGALDWSTHGTGKDRVTSKWKVPEVFWAPVPWVDKKRERYVAMLPRTVTEFR
jgi:hypothetical protein